MNRREILFRGKRTDNGEWVQGSYVQDKEWARHGIYQLELRGAFYQLVRHEINPPTIGQFTGLLDKNGNRVFEWDVLRTETGGYGYVVWDDAAFAIKSPGSEAIDWVHSSEYAKCEVTGNIHDNPELIKTLRDDTAGK